MIKVLIAGTNEVKELSMVYRGMDFARDFVGNREAFAYDHEGNSVATQDSFDWWEKVCADRLALMLRMDALEDVYGDQAVMQAIAHVDYNDLEDETAGMNKALDEAFGTEVQ